MASLTETAYFTRRAINWTILAFIVYLILRFIWSSFLFLYAVLFPPKPPPPNHAFNKLPKLVFPAPESSPAGQMTYTLETITGTLPVIASESARVYFMPKAAANLLALTNTQEFARRLKFIPNPIQETRTVYRFDDNEFPLRKLRYDIVSNNFILRYGYEQEAGVFTEGQLRDTAFIEREATDFLQSNRLYNYDFYYGTHKITMLKLVGNVLIPIQNLSETDAMRVDFFRKSISRFSLVTPNPDEGQVRILFSGSRNEKKKILEVIYTYWPVDGATYATYTLKPLSIAWQELNNGGGFIARYPLNGESKAVIRTAYLAYYDSFDPQTYLQPVYVFEGDHGFRAYVHAVAPEWVE